VLKNPTDSGRVQNRDPSENLWGGGLITRGGETLRRLECENERVSTLSSQGKRDWE